MEAERGLHTLPELPYDYSALDPHISGDIMELHYSKHHATYVQGANTALSTWWDRHAAGMISGLISVGRGWVDGRRGAIVSGAPLPMEIVNHCL